MTIKSSLPSIFFTDEIERKYPSIFMYAAARAGKTHALRSLAPRNPLVLATEIGNTKGLGTLQDMHLAAIPLNTLEELVAVTSELSACAKPDGLYYNNHGPFHCLAVDSLTGIGVFLEDAAKRLRGWTMIWDAVKGGGKDPRQAYPYIAEKGRQVVTKLMALPIPLIITCREQIFTEGEGEAAKEYAAPELPGKKLPRELPGWPEATVRLRMVNNQRVLMTQPEGNVIAGVRTTGGKLNRMIAPDLDALITLLSSDKSLHPDALRRLNIDTRTPQQLAAEQRRKAQANTPTPTVR